MNQSTARHGIKKRSWISESTLRHGLHVLVLGALIANPAFGKPKKKGKDKDKPEEPVATMDSGADPAASETFEKGKWAPSGKTGKAKEEEDAAEEAREERERIAKQPKVKPKPRKPINAFVQLVGGFGRGPLNGPPALLPPEDVTRKGSSIGLTLGGTYDVQNDLSLGLRLPLTMASLQDPIGSGPAFTRRSQWALGAPELFAEYRLSFGPRTLMPLHGGIGVPIAMGTNDIRPIGDDMSASEFRHDINAQMDAALGWEEPELFWVKRMPVILGAGLTSESGNFEAHASLKLVIGFNVGDEITGGPTANSPVEYSVKAVSLREITKAGFSYQFLDAMHLAAGLDAWLVLSGADPLSYKFVGGVDATAPSPFQLVVEPRLLGQIGSVHPSLGVILPVGGRLGDAGAIGVRLKAEVSFD